MPNLAIIVGIDKYWTALNSLTGAVADAVGFASWLIESGTVAAESIHLGLHPPQKPPELAACPDFEPTLYELDDLLIDLIDNPPAGVDQLWFYFSGHGASSSNPAYVADAICLKDFTDRKHTRALEIASLRSLLNAIPAQRRFMLIDGCRDQAFRDDIHFGTSGRQPRPAQGPPRNFELRATAAGRTAVEVSGRGLFSQHLLAGLRGEGSAKRWDPQDVYIVRWRALTGFVAERVAKPGGPAPDQLVTDMGERLAADDPELARFAPDSFGRLKLHVRLRQPEPPPDGARIWARRNDSPDEETADPAAANPVTFELAPSAWTVFARSAGHLARPRSKTIAVYEKGIDELEFELEPARRRRPPRRPWTWVRLAAWTRPPATSSSSSSSLSSPPRRSRTWVRLAAWTRPPALLRSSLPVAGSISSIRRCAYRSFVKAARSRPNIRFLSRSR